MNIINDNETTTTPLYNTSGVTNGNTTTVGGNTVTAAAIAAIPAAIPAAMPVNAPPTIATGFTAAPVLGTATATAGIPVHTHTTIGTGVAVTFQYD